MKELNTHWFSLTSSSVFHLDVDCDGGNVQIREEGKQQYRNRRRRNKVQFWNDYWCELSRSAVNKAMVCFFVLFVLRWACRLIRVKSTTSKKNERWIQISTSEELQIANSHVYVESHWFHRRNKTEIRYLAYHSGKRNLFKKNKNIQW